MSDAKFNGGYTTFEGEPVTAWVEGKRETVLLVTESLKKEPFIVRISEIL